ncbi:MAG: hypothetical protein KAT05_09380, partial [Spirochaetes bacterium]|nr:hypothetical protein [Spirochaetota bacterium]
NEINDTKDIAEKTMIEFDKGCKEITEKIDLQKSGFLVFYAMLTNYYEDFNKIFSSVSNLTENISKHINKFNPIFQLHDTSIQGLGNLNEMITKFMEENKEAMDKIIQSTDQDKKNEILNKLFSFVEDKITTEMEIEVVNKITKKYNLDREIKYSDVTVDMF